MELDAFSNCFWEGDGEREISSCTAGVLTSIDALTVFLERHAAMEEQHAWSLSRLGPVSATALPDELETTAKALWFLGEHCDVHSSYFLKRAASLRTLASELKGFVRECSEKIKMAEDALSSAKSRHASSADAIEKAKEAYYRQCERFLAQEAGALRDESKGRSFSLFMSSPSRRTKAEKCVCDELLKVYKGNIESHNDQYAGIVATLQLTHNRLASYLAEAVDRLNEGLVAYSVLCAAPSSALPPPPIDRNGDLGKFATARGTGSAMVQPVQFEPFDNGVLGGHHSVEYRFNRGDLATPPDSIVDDADGQNLDTRAQLNTPSIAWAHIDNVAVLEWLESLWEIVPDVVRVSFEDAEIDGRALFHLSPADLDGLAIPAAFWGVLLDGVTQLKCEDGRMSTGPLGGDDYIGEGFDKGGAE